MTKTPESSADSKNGYRTPPNPAQQPPLAVHNSDFATRVSAPGHSEDQSHTGLGAVRLHIEELRPIHDASAMAELRTRLNELKIASVWTFERAEIVALLKIVADVLDYSMEESAYVQHGAVGLLDRFIEALEDLDRGKIHRALEPDSNQANRALRAEQRRFDKVLLESVDIIRRAKSFKNRLQAQRYVAKCCQRGGLTRNGNKITAQTLKSLRDHAEKPDIK